MSIKDVNLTPELKEQLVKSAVASATSEGASLDIPQDLKLKIATIAVLNADQFAVPSAEHIVEVLVDQAILKYREENNSLVNELDAAIRIAYNNREIEILVELQKTSIFTKSTRHYKGR